jgi:hypothetical protein
MFAHRLMQHAFIAGTAVAFAAGLVGYFLSPARLALLGDLDEPVPGRRRRADRRGDQLGDSRVLGRWRAGRCSAGSPTSRAAAPRAGRAGSSGSEPASSRLNATRPRVAGSAGRWRYLRASFWRGLACAAGGAALAASDPYHAEFLRGVVISELVRIVLPLAVLAWLATARRLAGVADAPRRYRHQRRPGHPAVVCARRRQRHLRRTSRPRYAKPLPCCAVR